MTVPLLFKSTVTKQIPQSDRGPLSGDSTRMRVLAEFPRQYQLVAEDVVRTVRAAARS